MDAHCTTLASLRWPRITTAGPAETPEGNFSGQGHRVLPELQQKLLIEGVLLIVFPVGSHHATSLELHQALHLNLILVSLMLRIPEGMCHHIALDSHSCDTSWGGRDFYRIGGIRAVPGLEILTDLRWFCNITSAGK